MWILLFSLLLASSIVLRAADESWPPPFGPPPGVVIAASPDPQKACVFSPSLAILPNGNYVASYETRGHVFIKESQDRGVTWKQIADLRGQKWSTLFVHRDGLYLIGVMKDGDDTHMVISRSKDGGHTWTEPRNSRSGLLAKGHFHCGPTPVVVHKGRVWRAFEEFAPKKPTRRFGAFVMSAPEDADLLKATNWTRSNQIPIRREWLNTRNEEWLEGNVVVTPTGDLVDILRIESHPAEGAAATLPGTAAKIPRFEVAAMLKVSDDGRKVSFDHEKDFIHFIGSESKFTIRYDPASQRYWSIGSKITNPNSGEDWTRSPHHQRNVMSLTSSNDLRSWTENYRMLSYATGSVVVKEGSRVGFQYVDWQFDGDDIIAVCRMSWGGKDYHDSNVITFHRIKNFRKLTVADSPLDLAVESSKK
jgi:hypothetical protein